jgi:cardiolipin synthase
LKLRRSRFSVTVNNEAEFFVEGEAYYARFLQMISGAQNYIHLQTYIFELDKFGLQVKAELVKAAARGVKVYLLVDGIGSQVFASGVLAEFAEAGVQFFRFNEIHGRSPIGNWARRLHHKILLVDGKAMVGGINVISETFGVAGTEPHLDFAVLIYGEVIPGLKAYCEKVFSKAASAAVEFPAGHRTIAANDKVKLKISVNDWIFRRNQISKLYSRFVEKAASDIVIINSYFFPRRKFMKQLAQAARRGVRVRLILPMFSDWTISVLASEYLYSYFLKQNVEIYRWKKSVLHGKMATVDGHSTTVGSFNLNYTAYQQNLELNVDVLSDSFTQKVNARIEDWIANSCERASLRDIEGAALKVRVLRFLSYVVMSLIANFSVAITTRNVKSNLT